FEWAALRLDPQRLHDEVEHVRTMKVDEVEDRRVLHALDLQLRVRACVGGDERGWRNAEHVLRELFLVHELWPRHAHELDADAHEAHVVDVRRDVRTRAGKTHPRAIRSRLGKYPAPQIRREIIVHDEFAAYDAVGLRIAAALESSGLPQIAHLGLKARNDR